MEDKPTDVKHLFTETVKAFKSGMSGEEYENPFTGEEIPGDPEAARAHRIHEQMSKLEDLRAAGTLTPVEFEHARARVLESGGQPTAGN